MRLATLVAVLLLAGPARAQTAGTCATGEAQASLDINRVRAALFNTGSLFFGGTTTNGDGYVVPKESGKSPIYAANLWVGGQVNGEVRVAAALYTNFNFWPGPLEPGTGLPPTPADCSPYDRVYVVSTGDVSEYYRTGVATADLRDWPAHLGAPVLDGDGDPTNYNLRGGDQPAISGDGMAWWVMNDAGNVHPANGSAPLGVEVRGEAFAVRHPVLDQTTMYRFTVVNGGPTPIDSLYVGMYVDADLGNASDDYAGTDTTYGMGYTYNADEDDEGQTGYGVPPAVGVQVLDGPIGLPNGLDDDRDGAVDEPGERLGLTGAPYIAKSGPFPIGEPYLEASHYYRRLQGLYSDGSMMQEGSYGYPSPGAGPPTRFFLAGDPLTGSFWSAENTDRQGQREAPGDKRFFITTGPFRLAPGEADTVAFAIPFAQGADRLDSVARLRALASVIGPAYRNGGFAPARVEGGPGSGGAGPVLPIRLGQPSPNPFTGTSVVRIDGPADLPFEAILTDVLGRRLAVLHDGPPPPDGQLRIDGAALAPGVYRLVVRVPAGEAVRTMARLR